MITMRRGKKKPRPASLAPKQARTAFTRKHQEKAIIAVAAVLMVLLLLHEPARDAGLPADIDTSVIPRDDIRAATSYRSVDLTATKIAQDEAAARVPSYYQIDQLRVRSRMQVLELHIQRIEEERDAVAREIVEALRTSDATQTEEEIVQRTLSAYVAALSEEFEWAAEMSNANLILWLQPDLGSLPERIFEAPPEANDADAMSEALETTAQDDTPPETPAPTLDAVRLETDSHAGLTFTYGDILRELAMESAEYALRQGIRKENPENPGESIVIFQQTPTGETQPSPEMPIMSVPTPEEALEQVRQRLVDRAKEAAQETEQPTEWAKLHEAAIEVLEDILVDTIRADRVYSAGARERAREMVEPVYREIRSNMKIQAGGEPWTPQSIVDLEAYYDVLADEALPSRQIFSMLAAYALLVLLVLAGIYRSFRILLSESEADEFPCLYNLALLLLVLVLAAGWVGAYFEPTGFLIPVAAVGILFAILANMRMAVLVGIAATILLSAQYQFDWRLLVVGQIMTLAGIFSIFRVRRRSDMAKASLTATGTGLLAMLALVLAKDSLLSDAALRYLLLVGMNGAICLMVVPALLSPLERLFGITTDIQLLEYSDLNNELLNRLAIEVPGTYAHSLLLGQLAEAAADAIGANGLKARVCAYYHDIGKMRRPTYFVENQNGENVHDALSPRLSARAIAAHVTQGAEMAREYHLPRPIIDGILEHHGTFLIGYFYQQALEQQKHGDVQEEDFRYPGPKPQHPETAILMICDACESGIRSIKNPNEDRVREFVDKIVAARIADRQFDECNLTLRQLDKIADVVAHRIAINLHTRVAYPDMKSEKSLDPEGSGNNPGIGGNDQGNGNGGNGSSDSGERAGA